MGTRHRKRNKCQEKEKDISRHDARHLSRFSLQRTHGGKERKKESKETWMKMADTFVSLYLMVFDAVVALELAILDVNV